MKFLSNLSGKKFGLILSSFIILSIIGGVILYMNNPKIKFIHLLNREYKSFVSMLDKVGESDLATLSKNNTLTLDGDISFYLALDSETFGDSMDPLVKIINNLNINFAYGSDPKSGNTYLKLNSDIDYKDFIDMEVYQMGEKKYTYYNGIFDKYIESDGIDYINSDSNQLQDTTYLTDKIKVSLLSSLKTSDFREAPTTIKVNGEDIATSKITLTLNNKRLKEILTVILTDLKDDTKCLDILNELSGEDTTSSIDNLLNSIKDNTITTKDVVIDIYTKNNVIVQIDIMSGSSKVIKYTSYEAFSPTKKIIVYSGEQVALEATIEQTSINEISYKISLSNGTAIADGSTSKKVNNADKVWNTDLSYVLNLSVSDVNIGSLNISLDTITEIGEEIKMIDITNAVKEEELTDKERDNISSKLTEKIINALPITLPKSNFEESLY